jgi:hypothetical protein
MTMQETSSTEGGDVQATTQATEETLENKVVRLDKENKDLQRAIQRKADRAKGLASQVAELTANNASTRVEALVGQLMDSIATIPEMDEQRGKIAQVRQAHAEQVKDDARIAKHTGDMAALVEVYDGDWTETEAYEAWNKGEFDKAISDMQTLTTVPSADANGTTPEAIKAMVDEAILADRKSRGIVDINESTTSGVNLSDMEFLSQFGDGGNKDFKRAEEVLANLHGPLVP